MGNARPGCPHHTRHLSLVKRDTGKKWPAPQNSNKAPETSHRGAKSHQHRCPTHPHQGVHTPPSQPFTPERHPGTTKALKTPHKATQGPQVATRGTTGTQDTQGTPLQAATRRGNQPRTLHNTPRLTNHITTSRNRKSRTTHNITHTRQTSSHHRGATRH